MKPRAHSRGFSMMEVLIALVIMSVGLIGLAGLLVASVKMNHGAYQRTQATAITESMANRMRANIRAVWSGAYLGNYPRAGNAQACRSGSLCSFSEVAARDAAIWSQELSNFLPQPQATIACVRSSGWVNSLAGQANRPTDPPYDGLCTITVSWAEATLETGSPGPGQSGAPVTQTFAWVFQP